MSEPAVLILSTAATRAEAERIARALVEERLAACVQIAPVASVYRWQGAIETAEEVRIEAKTLARRAEAAMARIAALHGYDVPEIVVVPITNGSPAYLDWITASVSPPSSS